MIAIALLSAALAQAGDTIHEVDVRGGVDSVVRQDRQLVGTTHTGFGPGVQLGWSPRGPRTAHVLEVGFTPAQLSPGPSWSFTNDGDTLQAGKDAAPMAELRYAVGRQIDAGPWTLHLGGTVASHFENITTNFGFYGLETYMAVIGIAPWMDLRRDLGERHTLEAEAWIPLAGWVARNPYGIHSGQHLYNVRDNKPVKIIGRYLADGTPQTLNHYQAVHLRLGYAFDLSDTFALTARGNADGIHLVVPFPLVEWQFGLNLGIRGRF